jgi:hypothetical protein
MQFLPRHRPVIAAMQAGYIGGSALFVTVTD